MFSKKSLSAIMLIIAASLLFTACTAAAPAEPTPDLALLEENTRKTVVAEITADAKANPTAVFTLAPTYTPYPTLTVYMTPTETPLPTETPTPEPSGNQAKFLYANTYPVNARKFRPNENFNIAFGFENVGEVTWDPSYALVFVGGDQFTAVTSLPLGRYVEPGEKCEFNLGSFGSEDMRRQTTYWHLISGPGETIEGGAAYFSYEPY